MADRAQNCPTGLSFCFETTKMQVMAPLFKKMLILKRELKKQTHIDTHTQRIPKTQAQGKKKKADLAQLCVS